MAAALEQARRAGAQDEVPIGAVVMRGDEIVAEAHNETVTRQNPTYHAEFLAIERALEALETDRLTDCTLYVTLEPCAQCAGAIVLAKVGKLVFGAYDEKAGMCGSVGDLVRHPRLNHRVDVRSGVEAEACAELLKDFFSARRPASQQPRRAVRRRRRARVPTEGCRPGSPSRYSACAAPFESLRLAWEGLPGSRQWRRSSFVPTESRADAG